MDCLKDCNGACCKGFPIVECADAGTAELYELRGLKVIGKVVFTPPCKHLNQNGLCSIELNKPEYCRRFVPGCPRCLQMREFWTPKQK